MPVSLADAARWRVRPGERKMVSGHAVGLRYQIPPSRSGGAQLPPSEPPWHKDWSQTPAAQSHQHPAASRSGSTRTRSSSWETRWQQDDPVFPAPPRNALHGDQPSDGRGCPMTTHAINRHHVVTASACRIKSLNQCGLPIRWPVDPQDLLTGKNKDPGLVYRQAIWHNPSSY